MNEEIVKIFDGINLHFVNTDKFKTDLMAVFFVTELNRENVTKNALIPAVLRRGTEKLQTMKEISIKLEDMYGSVIDASSDKLGDRQVVQFYINSLNNNYSLDEMDIQGEAINLLCDIILNPKLENGFFDEEYVKGEKETLRELIESKINDKGSYSMVRCVEEMCNNEPYGLYKFGYVEDLEKIDAKNLYEQYKNLLSTSEIHIYLSGLFNKDEFIEKFKNRFAIVERKYENKSIDTYITEIKRENREVVERQDVTQGKLVLGYRINKIDISKDLQDVVLYATILGGTPGSKLFQNVREKASLAYTIRSIYVKHKGILMVAAGIEIDKYDEAHSLILKQIEDIKNGVITEEEIKDAKSYLTNSYKSFYDDQAAIINFDMGQTLLNNEDSIDECISKINAVTKDDVIRIANKLELQLTYFLTGKEEDEND